MSVTTSTTCPMFTNKKTVQTYMSVYVSE